MSEEPETKASAPITAFGREVGAQEARRIGARRAGAQGVWAGFGMFGLIGWSVAMPTVLGALGGMWLDKHRPGSHSWTMALLVIGLCVGCLNAWHWVAKEDRAIRGSEERDN